jgi:lytic murein transglycosylase
MSRARPARDRPALGLALATLLAPAAASASCGNDATGFDAWLAAFRTRAPSLGLPTAAVAKALSGVGYNATTIRLDRSQRSFKLSFDEFYRRRVSSSLVSNGQRLMQSNAALLARIEARFGVPPAVLISLWGLETNYGRDGGGRHSIVGSLATLAYDCRRSAFFENELVNAIRIVANGDMSAGDLVGGWAGEIGPMQFLPSSYVKFAVDFDGDGRRDLKRSIPDMLASTANYLKSYGWKAGQPWTPGTANYEVIRQWNKAEVYAQTIAVMSARMAGR